MRSPSARDITIVSLSADLERARPIWVGGEGRKETDIDLFFKALGRKKSARIKLAAMDMWKPFRNSVINNATQCADHLRQVSYHASPVKGSR